MIQKNRVAVNTIVVLIISMFILQASASATTVFVKDVKLRQGQTTVLPITIHNLTGDVSGTYIKLIYDQSVVNVTKIGGGDFNFVTFKEVKNDLRFSRYAAINWPHTLNT